MSNYVKATDFASKDALLTGDPLKIVSGTEINDEYNAIQTAVSTKADINSPTLTGVPAAPTAVAGTSTTQIATTAFVKTADDALQAAIDLKANIDSPSFTGTPTTPTVSATDDSTQLANTAFVQDAIAAGRGFIAFNGSTGATIASQNLTLTKVGTGDYTITCDASLQDGSSNWAVTVGNVDEGTLSQSTVVTTDDNTLAVYNCFVSSRSETTFTLKAKNIFNDYRVFVAADTDGNATQMFGITAVDPTYIVATLY
jgi:hypothetical protein